MWISPTEIEKLLECCLGETQDLHKYVVSLIESKLNTKYEYVGNGEFKWKVVNE